MFTISKPKEERLINMTIGMKESKLNTLRDIAFKNKLKHVSVLVNQMIDYCLNEMKFKQED